MNRQRQHHRNNDDLRTLLTFARREQIKIILSLRPYALERINSSLISSGFDLREIKYLKTLNKLSRSEMIELALQALGKDYEHLAERLTAVTGDSPLLTVIGGRLLAEKEIFPSSLECDDDFRHAALDKFQEFLLGMLEGHIDPELCISLLKLISAISPIRLDNEQHLRAIESFLGKEHHELIDSIDMLEDSGVLLRRGYTLRITPDVLSDHILHKACLTSHGQVTGYALHVFHAFEHICPEQVLQNLAEQDWRINVAISRKYSIIEEIWQEIDKEYKKGSNSIRYRLLNEIGRVAYYQPKRVLDL